MTSTPQSLGEERDLKLPQVLSDLAEFNLKRFGEYTMLHYEGRELTNTQVADAARRLAAVLISQGVAPVDRVIIMLVNSPEVFIAYQAVWRAGGVIVPVLPVLKTIELQHIAANCQPRAIITNLNLAPIIQPALEAALLPKTPAIIATGDPAEVNAAGLLSYEALLEKTAPLPLSAQPAVQLQDPAIIIYTSGTTGQPKGVVLSHNNQLSNLLSLNAEDFLMGRVTRPTEMRLSTLPLAHAMGLTGSNSLYLSGDPVVLLPRFEVQKLFEAIEKFKIPRLNLVPAILIAMLNYPDADKYDTSSLIAVGCGSAPLPAEVRQRFEQRFKCVVTDGYGLSEANTVVAVHRPDIAYKVGSVGMPVPGVEVRIVDNDANPLPSGERGEIVVRGPNIMLGYYNNPGATQDTIRNGWLHTGDVGYLDEDGYLFVVDRKKDLIIRNGQNIHPRDVEEVLAQHPAVREVAVVGIPSEKYGEEVKAYVGLRDDQQTSAEELIAYSQQFLANYKTPAYIEFMESLPRNPVGKINKRALREIK